MLLAILTFTAAAAVLTITPGLDTALVLRTALLEGRRRAMLAGLGICCGLLGWGLLVSAGLGAVLAVSQWAYDALRIAGAAYLFYLGIRLIARLREPTADRALVPGHGAPPSRDAEARRWFVRGLMTNLLNPKVGVFYVTFLPQFIPADANIVAFSVLLALIHALEGIAWFAFLTQASESLAPWLRRPSVARVLEGVTGGLFILFGIRLVLEQRG
jgi:threonine/homoserine/homoserine lactone efflux protein